MNICATLIADPQYAKSVNSRKGCFGDLTPAAEAFARFDAVPRDAAMPGGRSQARRARDALRGRRAVCLDVCERGLAVL